MHFLNDYDPGVVILSGTTTISVDQTTPNGGVSTAWVQRSRQHYRDPRLSHLALSADLEEALYRRARSRRKLDYYIPLDEQGRAKAFCSHCHEWQRQEAFSPDPAHPTRRRRYCKTCEAVKRRERYRDGRDEVRPYRVKTA